MICFLLLAYHFLSFLGYDQAPAPAPAPAAEKVPKKISAKASEKKGKIVEVAKEVLQDPLAEKLRQERWKIFISSSVRSFLFFLCPCPCYFCFYLSVIGREKLKIISFNPISFNDWMCVWRAMWHNCLLYLSFSFWLEQVKDREWT